MSRPRTLQNSAGSTQGGTIRLLLYPYAHKHTCQHLSETASAAICEKAAAFARDQERKQSSYPGALSTKPRTTASMQRSGTHSTRCQEILCQMQSDLVSSARRGTKTLRISSEVEERKRGKYTDRTDGLRGKYTDWRDGAQGQPA